jgi:hypothetical protein
MYANKSTGLDEIPAQFIKDGANIIKVPITAIINQSITTGVVPQSMKYARAGISSKPVLLLALREHNSLKTNSSVTGCKCIYLDLLTTYNCIYLDLLTTYKYIYLDLLITFTSI